MIFNDTKVVPARLFFKKNTGAHIEIFCLEPYLPEDYADLTEEELRLLGGDESRTHLIKGLDMILLEKV